MNSYMLMREFGLSAADQAFLTDSHLVRYLALLTRVVESGGINEAEQRFIDGAVTFADLTPEAAGELRATVAGDATIESIIGSFGDDSSTLLKKCILRDALRAALADDEYTDEEKEDCAKIAKNLGIPDDCASAIMDHVMATRKQDEVWDSIDW